MYVHTIVYAPKFIRVFLPVNINLDNLRLISILNKNSKQDRIYHGNYAHA